MELIKPIDLIMLRTQHAKEDSDVASFLHLMYAGEQLVKLIVVGSLACVEDDNLRHRYNQEYRLVRADGIGEWSAVLDEVLSGPTSQFLCSGIRTFQRQLLEATKEGSWQYEGVRGLHNCLKLIDPKADNLPVKTQARNWFNLFSRLRNKTRGHGAVGINEVAQMIPHLENAINLYTSNLLLLKLPWVYLRKNLNGKYRVYTIAGENSAFSYLKTEKNFNFPEGIYLHVDTHRNVRLMISNPELDDFFFPNGNFGKHTFECLSYITNNKLYLDVTPFLTPSGPLPKSQTEGLGGLDLREKTFTNLPLNPSLYIQRDELEIELLNKLCDERHPVITLVGRGGIGKTSLAISVLNKLSTIEKFAAIIWLSARDIDLLVEGAKPVTPNVLTISDISKEFARLMGIPKGDESEKEIFEKELQKSSIGPLLIVVDNFETVVNPKEVYSWLNTHIRLPNKILITSRFRDFKGDYPVEVNGMNFTEFILLVKQVAKEIGLTDITEEPKFIDDLFNQSDGHPYVTKILLGEKIKEKQSSNIKMVFAGKDDILTALFERTFNNLSPLAKRIFLTASNWRSTVPEVALEAILLRSQNEPVDVENAIEELSKSSLIDTFKSESDSSYFVSVPLSACLFGKKKLSVDPFKSAIEVDTGLLHAFGASTKEDTKHGLKPRIEKLFIEVAKRVSTRKVTIKTYLPILEFICTKYHEAWFLLSSLYEEENKISEAINSIKKFLESPSTNELARKGWQKLAKYYRINKDWNGEIHALVEFCLVDGIPFFELSNAINSIIRLFTENKTMVDSYEKNLSLQKVINVFEDRIKKEEYVDADDYSRQAWLYLHLGQNKKAKSAVTKGLDQNPSHVYCNNLRGRL